jgi:hypothetical protein
MRCPECGARGYSRKTKTPEWRCSKCGCEWDSDTVTTTSLSSDSTTGFPHDDLKPDVIRGPALEDAESEFDGVFASPLIRKLIVAQIRSTVFVMGVATAIWCLPSFFLPNGWWHGVINIGMFLVTALWGISIKNHLQSLGNPGWLAWGMSLLIWLVMVLVVRSIGLAVLDAMT